jgi:hypothetical protein
MRKPEVWLAYAEALGERRSLDWIHAHLGIARLTAWRWRHRLLAPLTLQPAPMLSGIVEADEAYFLRSFKGHRGWKNGAPPDNRPPRYRGSGAVKRGLSSEQVPVVTALDRVGGLVEAVLEGRRDDEIVTVLRDAIGRDRSSAPTAMAPIQNWLKRPPASHRTRQADPRTESQRLVLAPPRRSDPRAGQRSSLRPEEYHQRDLQGRVDTLSAQLSRLAASPARQAGPNRLPRRLIP